MGWLYPYDALVLGSKNDGANLGGSEEEHTLHLISIDVMHVLTGLSMEGEIPTSIEHSKVDRKIRAKTLHVENAQIFLEVIHIVDIKDGWLQWVAKIIVTKFLSQKKDTYIHPGWDNANLDINLGWRRIKLETIPDI